MADLDTTIRGNLARVRDRIAAAAAASGRCADEVALVAVTKYVGVAEARALLAAGCRDLAESRPQSLWEKAAAEQLQDARWHLVGHLQRNKVARTLPVAALIHSVDSGRLLEAIDAAADRDGRRVRVLLEVNCSGDATKHGVAPSALGTLLEVAGACRHVELCGLMTMAAREGDLAIARANFATLRELRDRFAVPRPSGGSLAELSMGMSRDLEAAVAEGATIVRVGSALFEGLPG
jgi:pyridoxal phosphate enzyme (YggS family)